eukprot:CAMPEP_0167744154 /NCGR_PEP_ID=MMETSP0110_2-20121227/2421_1 /TAXON_ID=629695 /ORGANISM="Gymnochlora sp., Strain CCMP2014" /LENGTH=204 /DNA_ID=CAMNT_0007628619 /DNA_START=40 /DNA_END=654 /DNA_ORIENTATION=+
MAKKKKDKKKKKKKKDKDRDRVSSDRKAEIKLDPSERVGVVKLIQGDASGCCEKKIVKLGYGRRPVKGQEVTMHCKGFLMKTKKKFWDTREKKQDGEKIKPYKFRVGTGKVIKGWDVGVQSMRLGEIARLVITGHYGYGLKGYAKWGIPPRADLEFEMEIISISDDVKLPDKYELMKQKVANRHTFLEKDPATSNMLGFRSAPF